MVQGRAALAESTLRTLEAIAGFVAMALESARVQQRQAEERAATARVSAILEHLPIVVAVVDTAGAIVHVNRAGRAFQQRIGAERPDWRECLSSMQVLDRDGKVLSPAQNELALAFTGEASLREVTLVTRLGERLHVLAISVPLRAPDGTVEAALVSFQEVTELRELADAKDRFLSIASHELRSPITSLRATTSLLQLDPKSLTDESRRAVLLARIQRQVDRLSTLVERLLDMTRLNAGELPLDYTDCDLAALCHDVVEHARLSDREHSYIVDAPSPIVGRWDPARLEQVLTNLLSNASRYSPPQSVVTVRAQLTDCGAAIDVIDHGPGIAVDQRDKLFTPFFRGVGGGAAQERPRARPVHHARNRAPPRRHVCA